MSGRISYTEWLRKITIPAICVPLTAVEPAALLAEAEQAVRACPDLVEWRADHMLPQCADSLADTAVKLKKVLGEIPLLFTIRTMQEGGRYNGTAAAYTDLILRAACTGCLDFADVEALGFGTAGLVRELQAQDICVIASSHDFSCTPSADRMEEIFRILRESGADVLKLAVMPATSADVDRLMEVTEKAHGLYTNPLISMSMGVVGRISRTEGERFGSCVTFGTVGTPSAPGQLSIRELRCELEKCHQKLQEADA
ncbi:MAG: type I 3-dehydroquinate dehydratase [Blautia sp.]|nr:type I 3-dehydroquinate dehydratase [Blautia sp.]